MYMPKNMEAWAEPALADVIREDFAPGILVPSCKVEDFEWWGVCQPEWDIESSNISRGEPKVVHPYRMSALVYFETISENG